MKSLYFAKPNVIKHSWEFLILVLSFSICYMKNEATETDSFWLSLYLHLISWHFSITMQMLSSISHDCLFRLTNMWQNLSNADFRFFVFHDSFLYYPWCRNSPPCGKSPEDEIHGAVCTCRMKWSMQGKLRANRSLKKLKKLSEVICVGWGATLLHSATAESCDFIWPGKLQGSTHAVYWL